MGLWAVNMNNEYDLIVLGGGPGGYNAAERASREGLKTLLIEKEQIGGVCLNQGCVPTKTLLAAVKHYQIAKNSADFGVNAEHVTLDWIRAQKRKANTISALRSAVSAKLKKCKVHVVKAEARFTNRSTIEANGEQYTASRILIATGSRSIIPPIPVSDSPALLTSREILNISQVPKSLVVIGGGVIGLEFASLFSTLGVRVSVVEMLPEIAGSLDGDIAVALRNRLEENIDFKLDSRVEKIEGKRVFYSDARGSDDVEGEVILMSAGRQPLVNDMGLKEIGLDVSSKGVVVNERMRTNLPGIWAVGDCTGKSLLAHSAYRMGEVAVANMMGKPDRMRYNAIPTVLYSLPEAAGVGLTEAEALRSGRKPLIRKLPMQYSARYLAEYGQEKGFCKMLFDARSRVLLGVHMIGGSCSEIIWGAAAMIEAEFRSDEMRELIFPHPTVSEIMRETLWEFEGINL